MKKVIISKMNLEYFKGIQSLEVNFNEGETTICGDNGTGKTTLFDAFTWLLFGKDSEGKTDSPNGGFSIKTLNADNSVIEKVDHTVSSDLYIDGRLVKLKRIYRERWVKTRGALEATLEGHDTFCHFDEIPVSISEYNRRVNDIISDAWFKQITNPQHFSSMNWKDQRTVLVSIAGGVTNQLIAEMHPEFNEIIEQLNGTPLADFKAKLAAQKKAVSDELKQIPTRIDQERKNLPEAVDIEAVKSGIKECELSIEKIDETIADQNKHLEAQSNAIQLTHKEINRLRGEQRAVIQTVSDQCYKEVEGQRKQREGLLEDFNEADAIRRETQSGFNFGVQRNNSLLIDIQRIDKQIEELRSRWTAENAKQFTYAGGAIICPLFKHECSDAIANKRNAEQADTAEKNFKEFKFGELTRINEQGESLLSAKAKIAAELTESEAEQKRIETALNEAERRTAEARKALNDFPEIKVKEFKPEEIKTWKELETEIQKLTAGIKEVAPADYSQYTEQKKAITAEIDELKKQLYINETRQKTLAEIDRLEKELRRLSQALADLEKVEYDLMNFNKAFMAEIDTRINSKFKYVSFKLFETQVNGAEKETCVILINGVPYHSANNAARINAGLDIINVICEHNGISAPIFIDNRESVNELIPCESQIINLIVTKDKALKIN